MRNVSYTSAALRLERGAAFVWFAVAAFAYSDAGVAYPLWMALFFWMAALAAWWSLRTSAALVSGRLRGESWGSRLLVPAVLATGIAIASSSVLLTARVRASERALLGNAAGLSQIPAGTLFAQGRHVGLFTIREFQQSGGEMRFVTGACGLVDQCGLVYSPFGRPQNRGKDSFRHLYGRWWHWYQSF
jgi:hypothetical protein